MGVLDQALQDYLKDKERYADLVNGIIFKGKQMMNPAYIQDVQRKKRIPVGEAATASENENGAMDAKEDVGTGIKIMYLERERDFLRLHNKPLEKFFGAVEAQADPDYTMPVRLLENDGIEFYNQLLEKKSDDGTASTDHAERVQTEFSDNQSQREKSKKRQPKRPLIPVFHIVLYFGEKRWKSKLHLREMFDIPEKLKDYGFLLPDYHVNLADVHEQDPELFHTEWKDIFRLMGHSRKKEELKKYIEEHMDEIRALSLETRWLISVFLGQYRILSENEVEVSDMSKAWDGAMEMYRDEGRAEGRVEGRVEGVRQNQYSNAHNMFRKGYPAKEIAEIVGATLETVTKWCGQFAALQQK